MLEDIPRYLLGGYEQLKDKITANKVKIMELLKNIGSNKLQDNQSSTFFSEIQNYTLQEFGHPKSKTPSIKELENQKKDLLLLQHNYEDLQSKLEIIMSENACLQHQVKFYLIYLIFLQLNLLKTSVHNSPNQGYNTPTYRNKIPLSSKSSSAKKNISVNLFISNSIFIHLSRDSKNKKNVKN